MRTSLSQLNTYANCGMAWKLSKQDKVEQLTAGWFHQGTAAHTAVESYLMGDTDPVSVYLREYDRLIAEDLEHRPDESQWMMGGRKRRDTDLAQRRDIGADQVKRWVQVMDNAPWSIWELPDGTPALEVPFSVEIADELTVIGYIDALVVMDDDDSDVRPVDWKTGAAVESARQLGVYKLAVEEIFGIEARYGGYGMMKTSVMQWEDLTMFTSDYVKSEFMQLKAGIENNVFLANPGKGCFTCTVKRHCALYR